MRHPLEVRIVARDDDDRDVRERDVAAEKLDEAPAVHDRHLQVEDDQGDSLGGA